MKKSGCSSPFCGTSAEVPLPDHLHRHVETCPDIECFFALIQEHVKAVEGPAAGFLRFAKKAGFSRIINNIRDKKLRVQKGGVLQRRDIGFRCHSGAGSIGKQNTSLKSALKTNGVLQVNQLRLAASIFIDPVHQGPGTVPGPAAAADKMNERCTVEG